MKQKEIKEMMEQVNEKPKSELAKFILDPRSNADDLIEFILFVDSNTFVLDQERYWGKYNAYDQSVDKPVTYNQLAELYLSSLKKK